MAFNLKVPAHTGKESGTQFFADLQADLSVLDGLSGQVAITGTATAGTATTLTDTALALGVNAYANGTIVVWRNGAPLRAETIVSNTATTITFATGTAVAAGDTYSLYVNGNGIPLAEKGAANGVATLDATSKLVQMPTAADVGAEPALGFTPENVANKNAVNGYAGLDANGEVIKLPAGAAAANTATVLRASGAWWRPGTSDFVSLTANYLAPAINTWSNVTNWSALQTTNFTYAAGVFTCAKAGRYRIGFFAEAINQTQVAYVASVARVLFSVGNSHSARYHTFESTASAYGSLVVLDIADLAINDTFSPQYYVTSNANGGMPLWTTTNMIIEEL